MHLITFLILYPVIIFIAIIPFRLIYIVSDCLGFLLYRVFKYRFKMVRKNLRLVFPDKSIEEIKKIEKDFYRHFADITIESIKAFGMNENQMRNRYKYVNIELIKNIQKKKMNIIIICGHYSNFEWLLSIGYNLKGNGYGIFTPMTNKYFNSLFKRIRMKHKAYMISRYKVKDFMTTINPKKNYFFGFAADQSPRKVGKSYINYFLGHKVPIFTGAERFSKDYDLSVVFADITRTNRGYYKTKFIEIVDQNDSNYSITDQFLKLLENQIYRDPSQYFWSHNRFKHLSTD